MPMAVMAAIIVAAIKVGAVRMTMIILVTDVMTRCNDGGWVDSGY